MFHPLKAIGFEYISPRNDLHSLYDRRLFDPIQKTETLIQRVIRESVSLGRITSQSVDPKQYLNCHLKGHISTVPYDFGTDFYQFRKETAKRPVFDFAWKDQASEEIAQIVSQYKQPEPYLI